MAIITVNQANDIAKLGDFIAEVVKDPKAWVKTSEEIKAAKKLIEDSAEAGARYNSLQALEAKLDAKEVEINKKEESLKALKVESDKQKSALDAEIKAFAETVKLFEKKEEALKTKDVEAQNLAEQAKIEIAEAKKQADFAKTKQTELDAEIAKYKAALSNLQAASV